jgi:hypothetical protein
MPSVPPAAVDIMDDLLRASDDAPYPGQQALERLIRRAAAPRPATPPAVAKPAPAGPGLRPVPAKAKKVPKRKATHYFAADAVTRLGDARDALAALAAQTSAAPGQARRVSKSAVLEAALTLACDAFETAGPDSPLARRLLPGLAPNPPDTGA